jgi:trigger factor
MNTEKINIEVQKPLEWSRVLKIKVPPERIDIERDKIVKSVRKKAKIPGFRHGKAPIDLVSRHYRSEIESETIEAVINRAVEEALEKEELNPITRASVENVRYDDDRSLAFEASFDIQPEIDLQRYTSFKIKRDRTSVEEGEIDAFLENLMAQNSTFHPIHRPAEEGDMVTIDFTPLDEDKGSLDKQKVYDVKVLLGEKRILPDIEAALYGKEAGQELTVEVTYPDNYHMKELQGTRRDFQVIVKGVEERRIPALDNDWVRSHGEFEDVESFKAHIGEELLHQKESESDRKVEDILIDNIIDANPFEVPQSMVNAYVSGVMRNFGGSIPETEDETKVDEQIRPIAEREVKKNFIIDIILKKENLEPKADEIEREVERLAVELNKDLQEFKSSIMGDPDGYNTIRRRLARKKVFDFLVDKSEITVD